MRRIVRGLVAVAALAVFSSCSDSSGPNGAVEGSYALITVNGLGLPVVIYQDQFVTFRITSADLVLDSDGTFSTTGTYQEQPVIGQTVTSSETCTGTWTRTGNSITFGEINSGGNCGGTYTGTWDGNDTLTVAFDAALQAVFRK